MIFLSVKEKEHIEELTHSHGQQERIAASEVSGMISFDEYLPFTLFYTHTTDIGGWCKGTLTDFS